MDSDSRRTAAVAALLAAALAAAAAPSLAAPPDGQIVSGMLDARASFDLCDSLEATTGVQVSHITLCDLAQPKCQQFNLDVNQGLALLTCPNRVAQVTAPSAVTTATAPAETDVTLNAVSMSTNLRYNRGGASEGDVDALYCKSFADGGVGARACRRVEASTAAVCGDDTLIVNRRLQAQQCAALVEVLRSAGARNPVIDFAIIENFTAVGTPGQTAIGVCGTDVSVQCASPGALGVDGVTFKDIVSGQWNQTETCTYVTIGGTRYRRCS
ncbi:MAG: hypothetical protein U0S49_06810 [Rhodospirillales bacterium]|nr:hypothetical protein [Rhodospirillales bacterium]